jgi:hypothetical protein
MRRRGLRLTTPPKNRTETNTALVQPAAPPRPLIPLRECPLGDKGRAEHRHRCAGAALRHSECRPPRAGDLISYQEDGKRDAFIIGNVENAVSIPARAWICVGLTRSHRHECVLQP